jgi:hypothetical protein
MQVQATPADALAGWRTCRVVQRWCAGLLQVTGLSAEEVASRREVFLRFCADEQVEPERMVDECQNSAEKEARRAFYLGLASASPANLIVQSFLVHNGVNVFGDLICMPRTRQQLLTEQGEEWVAEA